jgi:hypothetical protein
MILQIALKELKEIVREGRFCITAITVFALLLAALFLKEGSLVEQLTTDQINHADLQKLYLKHMN